MRRRGLFLAAAALALAARAWAQSEMEQYTEGANALLASQREVIQRSIDVATQALRDKDYAKARKFAQPVTRADPKRVESWLLLGAAQQGLADWSGARRTYTTAVRLAADNPEARAGLGIAYARTHDPKATVQLAWLAGKVQECGGCWRLGQLRKLQQDLQAAIAESATPPPGAP
jgi:cytochrome c-type biogenesis protein CcmH/NrfG